ncbi:Protein regulator of cytokinesis 1 [Sciurus carolinensis]|uniref:Protein regulator of cytokinesis 1 n=1 Tax=Sciurus carolinensis TaxID=30640 RepID=A0AA41N6D1_SCICA|nr:Protein regulator of cytokinesis 1 [Sciurus carolinensis]
MEEVRCLDSLGLLGVFFMRRSEVLAEESIVCLQKVLNHLREIWELIAIPEDQGLQRTEVAKKHIKDLLDMMIAEEESLMERLIKSISTCQKELKTLCSELHVEPFQEEGEMTIFQLEKYLCTQVELIRKQKKERKQELKLLQEQEQELCEILCMPHYDIDSTTVPSLEELNQFRQHVATLRETKASRHEEFVNIKRQIILCMEELDHTPDTSFEKDVVCEAEDAFYLSLENIATLQKLLQQLEM